MIKPTIYLGLILLFTASSCRDCIQGVGEVIPETRSVEPFDEVELNSFFPVTYREIKSSGVDKVVVTAQENLLPYIKVTVEDAELIVDVDECIETDQEISLEIYGGILRSIENNGSGDFSSDGKLSFRKLNLESNGSGDVSIKLEAQSLEVELNGSGDVTVDGAVDYLEVENNGSGDLEALGLRTFETEASVNGSGEVSVYVKEMLDAEINGSGDITYKGKAKITKSLNGSGTLKQKK